MEENSRLSEELESSSIATATRERNEIHFELEQTVKAQSAIAVSVCSSQQARSYISYVDS
jgi:hypothetical protein